MRRFLPILGMIGLLILTLALRAYTAQPVKAQGFQQVITATLTATPNPTGPGAPTSPSPILHTPTSTPQFQPTQMNALPYGPKMGMGSGTMGNGKMGVMNDMKGGKQRRMGMSAGQGSDNGFGRR